MMLWGKDNAPMGVSKEVGRVMGWMWGRIKVTLKQKRSFLILTEADYQLRVAKLAMSRGDGCVYCSAPGAAVCGMCWEGKR